MAESYPKVRSVAAVAPVAVVGSGSPRAAAVLRMVLGWSVVVGLWELAGRTIFAGSYLIGVPSGIVTKLVEN